MGSKDNVDALMFSLKDDTALKEFFAPELEDTVDNIKTVHEVSIEHTVDEIAADKSNELETSLRPGISKRLFGKIEAGSIRGSIFNMAILSLGTGCLTFPKTMGDMSLVLGLISIALCGIVTYWTLSIFTIVSEKHKTFNYSKLVRKIFGNGIGNLVDFCIMFYVFGILTLYQVVRKIFFNFLVYKCIGEIVYNFGEFYNEYDSIEAFINESFWNSMNVKIMVSFGITLFIVTPLCLIKDVSRLRIASLLGVLTLISLILLIIIQCPFYFQYYWDKVYSEGDPQTHLNIFNPAKAFDSNLFFFQGTATFFYSYTCHIGAIPILNSLKNNAMRRINKVISRTIVMNTFIFMVLATCGYLTWPFKTPSLIIGRENITEGLDIVMTIGRMAICGIIIIKIPFNINSFRISFYQMLFKDATITNKR